MTPTIGDYIRKYRQKKGISQNTLAKAVGCTQSFISFLESGKRKAVTQDLLEPIAEVLDVNIDYLSVLQGSLHGQVKDELIVRAIDVLDEGLN